MSRGRRSPAVAVLALSLLALGLAGCAQMPRLSWPFGAKPVAAPQAVDELVFESADGAVQAFPQYWKRNTLVIDLQAASPSGAVTLRPKTAAGWPVRMALRLRAGGLQRIEVRGEQRMIVDLGAGASGAVDFELDPAVYTPRTEVIELVWGAAARPDLDAIPVPQREPAPVQSPPGA